MQKYQLELEAEGDDNYKQELGLRKMLYKYQHENEQLRNQIKALTQRLTTILNKQTQGEPIKSVPTHNVDEMNEKYLYEQMNLLFKQIQFVNQDMKKHKELINEEKYGQFIMLTNKLKNKDHHLNKLKNKVKQFQEDQENYQASTAVKIKANRENQFQSEAQKLWIDLENLKKRVRELQRVRNQNHRRDLNAHQKIVDMESKNRKFREVSPLQDDKNAKKKGFWHLQLTEENYFQVKGELQQLKKQKNMMIESIKIENKNLNDKINHLQRQYSELLLNNNSIQMPQIPKKQKVYLDTPQKKISNTPVITNKSLNLGPSQYQRKNDKNYIAKKERTIEWLSTVSKKGLAWKDQACKSPITGINLWFDKVLIGIQFVHMMGESIQHLHLVNKKMNPIQYRLTGKDYVQNLVLVLADGAITGLQISSMNGRNDSFGQKVGSNGTKKFDYGIKNPQKPIFSYGSFIINKENVSVINKLGFAII